MGMPLNKYAMPPLTALGAVQQQKGSGLLRPVAEREPILAENAFQNVDRGTQASNDLANGPGKQHVRAIVSVLDTQGLFALVGTHPLDWDAHLGANVHREPGLTKLLNNLAVDGSGHELKTHVGDGAPLDRALRDTGRLGGAVGDEPRTPVGRSHERDEVLIAPGAPQNGALTDHAPDALSNIRVGSATRNVTSRRQHMFSTRAAQEFPKHAIKGPANVHKKKASWPSAQSASTHEVADGQARQVRGSPANPTALMGGRERRERRKQLLAHKRVHDFGHSVRDGDAPIALRILGGALALVQRDQSGSSPHGWLHEAELSLQHKWVKNGRNGPRAKAKH
eukprot:8266292-Alexandrium_andersonii.AAC.1